MSGKVRLVANNACTVSIGWVPISNSSETEEGSNGSGQVKRFAWQTTKVEHTEGPVIVLVTGSCPNPAGQPKGTRVRVTVTMDVTTPDVREATLSSTARTAWLIIALHFSVAIDAAVVKIVAVAGVGVIVVMIGQRVMETVEGTHVVQGGHLTSEHGIVSGRTTMTVELSVWVEHGTVTDEHPKMHVSNSFWLGSRTNEDGVVTGFPSQSVPVTIVVAMVTWRTMPFESS